MKVFEQQGWHLLFMLLFLLVAFLFEQWYFILPDQGYIGIESKTWFWVSIWVPIIHTIYVAIVWRFELHYKSISKSLGQSGFSLYATLFLTFLISRPISVIILALSDKYSFSFNNGIILGAIVLCSILSAYLGFSVVRYFGIKRAMGLDHFDDSYSSKPMVKKGIFKYTNNGMYLFGFLALYLPGLLLYSKAALFVALWSHLYIWVHFFFTEKVDFKYIYKKAGNQSF